MKTFEDIQTLWQKEHAERLPDTLQIKRIVKKHLAKRKGLLFLLFFVLFICFILLTIIFSNQKTNLWTTTLGEVLVVIGFILTLTIKLQALRQQNIDENKSAMQYLEEQKVKLKPRKEISKIQIWALILLGLGYGFYIYENVSNNMTILFLAYFGILVYLSFVLFIIRPWINKIKKEDRERLLKKIEFNRIILGLTLSKRNSVKSFS